MNEYSYEWDDQKNKRNRQKHNVSFEEAIHIFKDETAILLHDPDHSKNEERFLLLEISPHNRLLVVCHSYCDKEASLRIISVRKATPREWRDYVERQST